MNSFGKKLIYSNKNKLKLENIKDWCTYNAIISVPCAAGLIIPWVSSWLGSALGLLGLLEDLQSDLASHDVCFVK